MGKFLKKIQSTDITGVYSQKQTAIMNHYKDQQNNGPTIYSFENPNTKAARTAFVDKSYLYEYDDVTDFEWHFGYKNGYPGVYFTFHAISDFLKYNGNGSLICLETNNATRGKNKTIGVFTGDANTSYIIDEHQNVTWFDLSTIVLNQEYFIYICGLSSFLEGSNVKGPWNFASRRKIIVSYGKLPDDWTMTINIRPTIRFQTTRQPYTNYKALAKYEEVTYLYNKEYRF